MFVSLFFSVGCVFTFSEPVFYCLHDLRAEGQAGADCVMLVNINCLDNVFYAVTCCVSEYVAFVRVCLRWSMGV